MNKKKKTFQHFFSFYRDERFLFFSAIIAIILAALIAMLLPLIIGYTVDNLLLGEDSQTSNIVMKFFAHFGDREYLLKNLISVGIVLIAVTAL